MIQWALVLGVLIFFLGLGGVLLRRNLLVILMSLELMLNAINILFVTYSKLHESLSGQMAVLFIITVAAAESAVGLSLVIALFRTLRTVDVKQIQILKG